MRVKISKTKLNSKVCSRCNKRYSIDKFRFNKTDNNYSTYCKGCSTAKQKTDSLHSSYIINLIKQQISCKGIIIETKELNKLVKLKRLSIQLKRELRSKKLQQI
jgi:hypothetical protein